MVCCKELTQVGVGVFDSCGTLVSNQSVLEVVMDERTREKSGTGDSWMSEDSGAWMMISVMGFVFVDMEYVVLHADVEWSASV